MSSRNPSFYRRSLFSVPSFLPSNPAAQMALTVVLAVLLSGLVFSGLLTFRHSDYDDLMQRGEQLLQEGKVAKAAQVFETVLRQYGEGYPVYLNLGKAYLALNQPEKAEEVLQAALKLKPPEGSVDALLAQAQLLVVKGQYADAVALLKNRLDQLPEKHLARTQVKTTVADVYMYWADTERESGQLTDALAHYQEALIYVGSYSQEQQIQRDMADVALSLSEQYLISQDPKGLINAMAPIMEWSADPTLMIRLADAYQQTNDLEQAITWYRRAFDAEPENIRGKLSQVLLERGRQVAASGNKEAAQPYFNEAEALVAAVGDDIAKATLYPLRVSSFKVVPHLDRAEKTLKPVASFNLTSEAHRAIDALSVRLQYRMGQEVLAENVKTVATLEHPLGTIGEKEAKKSLTLGIGEPLHVGNLAGKTITAELAITYADAESFSGLSWQTKALQDIKIRAGGEYELPPTPEASENQVPQSFLENPPQ